MLKTAMIDAAAYIRMSSDKQEDSPERQQRDIDGIVEGGDYRVVETYADEGMTGTESRKRKGFQRMLSDAKAGKFKAVLLSEQSRMSREDVLDAMVHWRIFRDAGVSIVTPKGELRFDDLGGLITTIVGQHGAHDESLKLADRTVGGKRLRIDRKERLGGAVFGYDREFIDETGEVANRVHFRERFRKPADWKVRLVPSADAQAVEAIRFAFDAIRKGFPVSAIVKWFNDEGITTVRGCPHEFTTVKRYLKNPLYAGTLRAGFHSRGKFRRVDEAGVILHHGALPALVDRELFDEVQRIMKEGQRPYIGTDPGRYLLTGILTCYHCGGPMYGAFTPEATYYRCHQRDPDPNCPHPTVKGETVEQFVLNLIRNELLTEDNQRRLLAGFERHHERESPDASDAQREQLESLRDRIRKADENLALADNQEEFRAIAKVRSEWKDQERRLAKKLQSQLERPVTPDGVETLERLRKLAPRLSDIPRITLAHALRMTIKRIVFGRRVLEGTVKGARNPTSIHQAFGHIEFTEGLYPGGAFHFSDEHITPNRVWRQVGNFVRSQGRPVLLKEVLGHFGFTTGAGSRHLQKATLAGLIKRLGPKQGWVSSSAE